MHYSSLIFKMMQMLHNIPYFMTEKNNILEAMNIKKKHIKGTKICFYGVLQSQKTRQKQRK